MAIDITTETVITPIKATDFCPRARRASEYRHSLQMDD